MKANRVARHAVGAGATAAVLGATLALPNDIGAWVAVLAFSFVVSLATWWGGLISGLAATAVGVLFAFLASTDPASPWSGSSRPWVTVGLALSGVALAFVVSELRVRSAALPRERAARKHLSSIFDDLDAVVWEAEPQPFRFTFVSPAVEDLFGYSSQQWLGEPDLWAEHIHPDDRDRTVAAVDEAIERGADRLLEYRIVHADGRVVWIGDRVHVSTDRRRRAVRVSGRMVDITERKLSERRLVAVAAVTRAMTQAGAVADLGPAIIRALCDALGWQLGALWTVDEAGASLRCVELWHRPDTDLGDFVAACRGLTFERDVGLPGRIWASGRPTWIPDVLADDNFPRGRYAEKAGLHAAFGFPIHSDGRFLGVFEFFSDSIQEPEDELLEMMSTVGSQIGGFIERKRAEEDIAYQRALLESLSEGAIDGIMVMSPEGEVLSVNQRFREMWGLGDRPLHGDGDDEFMGGVLDQVADSDAGLTRIGRLAADLEEQAREEVRLKDGRVFDMWSVALRGEAGDVYGRAWYFRDISEAKRAERALQASRDRLHFLSEASKELASSLEYEETLAKVAALAVPRLADWCAVHVVGEDDRSIRPVAVEHVDPRKAPWVGEMQRRYPMDPNAPRGAAHVIRTGEAEFYHEIPDELLQQVARDADHLKMLRDVGFRSAMVVPLIAHGRILGAMTFVTAESDRLYGTEDLALAEALARRAAIAIENSRLYQERTRIARTLQDSLLPPRLPTIPGVEVAALFHAAGEGNEVGGDFYDVFRYGNRRWAVVIGDVSGKGAEAAALTGLVRYTVRFEAMQEHEPSRIVSLLNDAVLSQGLPEQFCTLVYIRLDHARDGINLAVVRAGHPSPLLLRADGTVMQVGDPAAPVGVSDVIVVDEELVTLRAGDTLVLYTDGVLEARVGRDTFGDIRLTQVVAACAGLAPEQITKQIETSVLEFCGGEVRDDIAILALRVAD